MSHAVHEPDSDRDRGWKRGAGLGAGAANEDGFVHVLLVILVVLAIIALLIWIVQQFT